MLNKLKEKWLSRKGVVSIELLMVAGVIIVLVVVTMSAFSDQAMNVNKTISNSIKDAQNQYNP